MTTEHWQQLESLFQAALERPASERAIYLAQACADDPVLQQEAEKLLASFDSASSFLETPAADSLGLAGASNVTPGQRIAHYEIISALGAGGMGEVYLAHDSRLERQIALKLLPAHFSRDEVWVARFNREARATSALNHPNILTIHEIGEDAGTRFIAAEYVNGQTLRQTLNAGLLPLRESLALVRQIAHALAAAHEAGIIHRDIKPENVMVRPDGLVKVLDFGLAKPLGVRNAESGVQSEDDSTTSHSAFRTPHSQTDPSLLMGTMAYLSPEQARHEELDARTDIYSLGIVLHELLTGGRPHKGKAALNDLPPALARIVTRALAPEREDRYRSAADLCDALEQFEQSLSRQPATNWRKRAAALVAAGLLIASAVWWWNMTSERPTFNAAAALKLTDQPGEEFFPSLSPDGQSVVYAARSEYPKGGLDIFRQTVGERNAVNLTASPGPDNQPVFSPDGTRIAFRSTRTGASGIFVMNGDGSQITQLTDAGFNPSWSPDGREIVLADELTWDFEGRMTYPHISRLWAVNVETRARRVITDHDAVQPNWSPHGHRIAFWSVRKGGHRDLWTVAATGGATPISVTDDAFVDWNPVWSPTGEHLYFLSNRSGEMNLWRVPMDETTGAVKGQPEPVTLPSNNGQYVSFARNGSALVYSQLMRGENLWELPFDPKKEVVTGAPRPLTQGFKRYAHFDFAPDDLSFVYLARGEPRADLFIGDRGRALKKRLTDDAAQDLFPRWSPDGNLIAFVSDRGEESEIWKIKPDGTGLAPLTHEPGKEVIAPVWSPDSHKLLYQVRGDKVYITDVQPSGLASMPQPLPGSHPPDLLFRDWSPDGLWLAGALSPTVQESRGVMIYSFAQARYERITEAGDSPQWFNDSRRLLFRLNNSLYLTDRAGAKPRLIYAIPSPNQLSQCGLSRDNLRLYLSVINSEADIWRLPLN